MRPCYKVALSTTFLHLNIIWLYLLSFFISFCIQVFLYNLMKLLYMRNLGNYCCLNSNLLILLFNDFAFRCETTPLVYTWQSDTKSLCHFQLVCMSFCVNKCNYLLCLFIFLYICISLIKMYNYYEQTAFIIYCNSCCK